MHEMGVTMDEKQLDNVMVQLDTEDDGGVDFQDLMTWYYVQKHGRDRIPPCPNFSPPDPEGPENPWDKFNPVKIADKIAQDVGKFAKYFSSCSLCDRKPQGQQYVDQRAMCHACGPSNLI